MNAVFSINMAGHFMERLTPPAGQYSELRIIAPDHSPSQFFCRTIDEALRVVERFSGTANIYVGACPRFRRGGTTDDVNTVVAFWADLDFHQIDPNRDVALELAYRRIEALGFPPTMFVHSGNGLQVWWLFHEPVAISDEWPADRFEAINRGLAVRLGGDHVHDLARVLRVPGTMNLPTAKKRGRGCVPVMARLLDACGPMYRPEDFAPLTAAAVRPDAERDSRRVEVLSIDALDDSVVRAFQRFLDWLGPHHPLTRTWEGRRQLRDSSRSGFDWALALQCARVGMKPDLVAALLRIYGFGKGRDAHDRYLRRTVARAYSYESNRHAS